MKIGKTNLAIFLILIAVLVSVFSVYVASQREITVMENTLLQSFSLLFGLASSFIFGQESMKEAAREMIKPHAKSAFRRLMSLYESLSRVAVEIQNAKNKDVSTEKIALAKLEAIVIGQLATADDALEDWADIVPEEVMEMKKKLVAPRIKGNNDD